MKPSGFLLGSVQYQECSVIVGHVLAMPVNMILVCVILMRKSTSVGWFEGPFYASKRDNISFDISQNREGSCVGSTDLLVGCHE